MLRDWQAYADGVNAAWRAAGNNQPPWTVNDVIATNAFIGSIFGYGGGQEVRNSDFLAKLRAAARGEPRRRRSVRRPDGGERPRSPDHQQPS